MKIDKISISGFRCFGRTPPTTITFRDDLTLLIGPNGAGKTAVLAALNRMFGSERGVRLSDFHEANGSFESRELWVEAWLSFPELKSEDPAADYSIPPFFRDLTCDIEGQMLLRIRLEATLNSDDTVEENIYAIQDADPTKNGPKKPLRSYQRKSIRFHYIPARRQPSFELGRTVGRLLKSIKRTEEWEHSVQAQSERLGSDISQNASVAAVESALASAWALLHKGERHKVPELKFTPPELESLLQRVNVFFKPGFGGCDAPINRLSDGQRSLFYLSMIRAVWHIERGAATGNSEITDLFDINKLRPAAFTLFGLEEPENHLSPHLLGRLMHSLMGLSRSNSTQTVLCTHAPALVSRVPPEAIVYLRLTKQQNTIANTLELPESESEAYHYVKETIRAFPELLFAGTVILGEGESEQIVLSRVFAALSNIRRAELAKLVETDEAREADDEGTATDEATAETDEVTETDETTETDEVTETDETTETIEVAETQETPTAGTTGDKDTSVAAVEKENMLGVMLRASQVVDDSYISVVPLRGRFAGHFWKLLSTLEIPFVTLLDLDLGREGGGHHRIKAVPQYDGEKWPLAETWTSEKEERNQTVEVAKTLEQHGVFFSSPLDLDYMMLRSYPDAYKHLTGRARGPQPVPVGTPRFEALLKVVLKPGRSEDAEKGDVEKESRLSPKSILERSEYFEETELGEFRWYRYLFGQGSKPASHIAALSRLGDADIAKGAPDVLKRMFDRVNEISEESVG